MSHTLSDGDEAREQRAESFPDEVPRQVAVFEPGHERRECDRRSAVDNGYEERQRQERKASLNPRNCRGDVPEEDEKKTRDDAHGEDQEDRRSFEMGSSLEVTENGEDERSDVGNLSDDDELGGEVVPLGDTKSHQEGQLHPEAVDGHPGPGPKEDNQNGDEHFADILSANHDEGSFRFACRAANFINKLFKCR